MARRRESIFESFLALPWWASAVAACVSYLALAYLVPASLSSNPYTVGIGNGLKTLAPIVGGLSVLTGIGSFARSYFIARKFNGQGGIDDLRKLSWQQFEMIVGEAFRRRGYSVIENGGGGADGGVDLVLRKDDEEFLVQCKQWKAFSVGVKPIREFFGVMTSRGAAGGFFVNSGTYTRDARDFAAQTGVELIDGPMLAQMVRDAQSPQPYLDPTVRQRRSTTRWPAAQNCPNCGGEMIERTSKRGSTAGSTFWGCKTYPHCRGTRPI